MTTRDQIAQSHAWMADRYGTRNPRWRYGDGADMTVWPWSFYTQVLTKLNAINAKLETIVSQQDEINTDVTELQAAVAAIAAEIAALQAANPALDLSGLQAAVASVQALAPAPSA